MSEQKPISYDPNTGKAIYGYDPNTGKAITSDSYMGMGPDGQRRPMPAMAPAPKAGKTTGQQVRDLIYETQKPINPGEILSGVGTLVTTDPRDTVKSIGASTQAIYERAAESFRKGNYGEAAMHALYYMLNGIPGLGTTLESAADDMKAGDYGSGMGKGMGMGLSFALPKVVDAALPPGSRVGTAGTTNAIPEEAAAVEFANRRGIPVDAGTAIGNPMLRGAKELAERTTLSGAYSGARGAQKTAKALERTLDDLAAEANTGRGARTIPQAGEGVATRLDAAAEAAGKQAGKEYDTLRAIERKNPVAFAVDIKGAQDAMRPLYEELMDVPQVAVTGPKARAIGALHKLMKADNTVSLSAADEALSELKAVMRSVGDSEQWSRADSILAQTVKALDDQVTAAANRGGVIGELRRGRAATIRKYDILDVVDRVKAEPNSTIKAMTSAKDGGIAFVRDVKKYAPESLPDVGNAVLEDLLLTSTQGGGFKSADKLFSDWHKLGKETKQALFADALKQNPAYLSDLDNFFLIAKRLAAKENPTGSGAAALTGGLLGTLFSNPYVFAGYEGLGLATSNLLRNPLVVRALTKGMSARLSGNRAAQTAAAGEIARTAEQAGIQLPAFATATANKDTAGTKR